MNRKQSIIRKKFNRQGMTLPELMIAVGILALCITGILAGYLRSMELNEISRNMSIAVKAAQSRLAVIRSTTFANIKTTFDDVAFDVTGIDAKGVSYVDDTDPDLLKIDVCVSWRTTNGRIFGQDSNLNGQIDGGEDTDSNGMLDAPVQITTYIYDK